MEVPKYLRLKIYSFLCRKDWVLISAKLSTLERELLIDSAILFADSDDKKMTLCFQDESIFAETFFLRRLFRDLTFDLTRLTSYKYLTDSIEDLH